VQIFVPKKQYSEAQEWLKTYREGIPKNTDGLDGPDTENS
jgi:hypothetical protein